MKKPAITWERQCNVIVGAPGRGKTSYAVRWITQRKAANVLAYVQDLNIADPAFKQFKYLKNIYDYKGGWAKVSSADIKYPEFLKLVLKDFRNGVVIIDEAELYEVNEMTEELKRIVAQRRIDKMNVDVLLLYHGLSQVPIRSQIYISHLVLFYTADNINYKGSKMAVFDELLAAKKKIAERARYAQKGHPDFYYGEVIKFS